MNAATSHFSSNIQTRLKLKGIKVVGIQAIPGPGPLPWANSEVAYVLDDNGTGKVRTFLEVLELARAS
jgi:hypothetical protein